MKTTIAALCLACSAHRSFAFVPMINHPTSSQSRQTKLLSVAMIATPNTSGISLSTDPDYPQNFTGRLWFSPALVKVKDGLKPGLGVTILSLFGYSLGGTVTLEYDTSPVGPYREYVTMSALAMKKGSIGQWGSRLYVSTQEAEDVCRDLWGVPAELANIDFVDEGDCLQMTSPPNPEDTSDINIAVEGWKNTKVLLPEDYEYADYNPKRWGSVPVNWTPSIKALWAPFVPFPDAGSKENELPMHKLRLSASAVRLQWSGFERNIKIDNFSEDKYNVGIPLGLGLTVDNVLIEIGTRCEQNL
eukprot:scaffold2154_cov283-Chaetoceros_neogracile.AAC.27